MTEENGIPLAIVFGIANEEAADRIDDQRHDDKTLDDWNSACGIGTGSRDDDERSCPNKCIELLKLKFYSSVSANENMSVLRKYAIANELVVVERNNAVRADRIGI